MKETFLTKNFVLMFFINTFLCIGFYMLMPILPIYAVHDVGLDEGKVGFIVGIFAISSVIGRPICGFSVDRFGRMVVYIPALIVFTLCFGSYILATTASLLLLVRLAHGFSWGVTNTASATVVSDIIPQSVRSQGIGYFGLSMTLAMAVGPSLGVFLLDHVSMKAIFVLSVILCSISLVMAFFIKLPVIPKDTKRFSFKNLFETRVLGLAAMQFFFGLIYSSVMAYAALHGLALNVKQISIFFLIYAISMAVTRPFGGRLMAKRGPTPLVIPGLIGFACGLFLLGIAKSNLIFLVSGVFLGVGGGFIMPTIMTMAINVVTPSRRGAANATIFTAFDVGIGSGAIVFGYIAKFIGYDGMYGVATLVVIIPTLLYFLVVMKKYKRMLAEMKVF